jgi:hypothetical protein
MTKMDSEEIQQAIEAASAEIIERFDQMPVKRGELFLRGMRQMVKTAENYYLAQAATTDDARQSFSITSFHALPRAREVYRGSRDFSESKKILRPDVGYDWLPRCRSVKFKSPMPDAAQTCPAI